MNQETKYYELSYLVKPDLASEDASRVEEELRSILGAHQAMLDSWDSPRRRQLAYAIEKHPEAYMGALRFTSAREYTHGIETAIKKNKNLLRFMLLEWKKAAAPRARRIQQTHTPERKEEHVPTDEKALDEKLEEIFGETISSGEQKNESRTKSSEETPQTI